MDISCIIYRISYIANNTIHNSIAKACVLNSFVALLSFQENFTVFLLDNMMYVYELCLHQQI